MGDDRLISYITSMFVFRSLFVQTRNLQTGNRLCCPRHTRKRETSIPDSSFRGTNELQRSRSQCRQRKRPIYGTDHDQVLTGRIRETHSICLLASPSSRFFAMRGRYCTVVRSAHSENISATGLLPWYAGRRIGFEGRGVRSVYLNAISICQTCRAILSNLRDSSITFHAVE